MIRRPHNRFRRPGAAIAEFAIVMTAVVFPLMLGIWEMGRAIQVQQIVSNAAREGARLASQGHTISQTGAYTDIDWQIAPATNTAFKPNVKAAVVQSLAGAGLTNLAWTDVTVDFAFVDWPPTATVGATDPKQGVKNQRFIVHVSIPFPKVRWLEFGLVNPPTIEYTVEWRMMVDDPFQVNTTIPAW